MTQIRCCTDADFDTIYDIINAAAERYRGVIPDDRWHDPYMAPEQLRSEIAAGVAFWAAEDDAETLGVMGIQKVKDVVLIRHAYVRPGAQGHGVGSALLAHLRGLTDLPILIGTWADATWAIKFYQRQGFTLVPRSEVPRLLRTYWSIPDRQVETSVVLADERFVARAS